MSDHVATAEIEIDAPPDRVWAALTDPEQIKEYMFGSQVVTDWKRGSPIVWKGEYEGKKYEDKGEVVEIEPGRRLQVTHFSPLSGQEDVPENYHTLLYELEKRGGVTHVFAQAGQEPERGGGRALAGELGEDAGGLEAGRRTQLVRGLRRRAKPGVAQV